MDLPASWSTPGTGTRTLSDETKLQVVLQEGTWCSLNANRISAHRTVSKVKLHICTTHIGWRTLSANCFPPQILVHSISHHDITSISLTVKDPQGKILVYEATSIPSLSWPPCPVQAAETLALPVPFRSWDGELALSPYPLKHVAPCRNWGARTRSLNGLTQGDATGQLHKTQSSRGWWPPPASFKRAVLRAWSIWIPALPGHKGLARNNIAPLLTSAPGAFLKESTSQWMLHTYSFPNTSLGCS